MDRGAWWATVHGVAQSDMTEATEQQQQDTGLLYTDSLSTYWVPGPVLGTMGPTEWL